VSVVKARPLIHNCVNFGPLFTVMVTKNHVYMSAWSDIFIYCGCTSPSLVCFMFFSVTAAKIWNHIPPSV